MIRGSLFTPEEDQALLDARRAGLSLRAIARHLGRPLGTIKSRYARWLDAGSFPRVGKGFRPGPPDRRSGPFTPEEEQYLITAYQAGVLLKTIAQHLNRTRYSVDDRLKKLADLGQVNRRRLIRESSQDGSRPSPRDQTVTAEDRAWMAWWSQPRAQRRHLEAQRHAD